MTQAYRTQRVRVDNDYFCRWHLIKRGYSSGLRLNVKGIKDTVAYTVVLFKIFFKCNYGDYHGITEVGIIFTRKVHYHHVAQVAQLVFNRFPIGYSDRGKS